MNRIIKALCYRLVSAFGNTERRRWNVSTGLPNMVKPIILILKACVQGSELNTWEHRTKHPSFGRKGERPASPQGWRFHSGLKDKRIFSYGCDIKLCKQNKKSIFLLNAFPSIYSQRNVLISTPCVSPKCPQSWRCHIISAGNHEPAENLRPILQNSTGAAQGFQKTHKSGGARSWRESASGIRSKGWYSISRVGYSILFYALMGLESNHRLCTMGLVWK